MLFASRRPRRLLTLLTVAAAFWCAGALPWLVRAQIPAAPGGLLELSTSTDVRALLTASDLQTLVPDRGQFTFPAPYLTTGVRLTNASDCSDWFDCVMALTGGSWRNINNSAGSNDLYVVVGLDRTNGGAGPSLFRYHKLTGATANLGPLFTPDEDLSWGGLEGWYFSARQPTTLYLNLDRQLLRMDVLTRTTSVVFDIGDALGDNKEVWRPLSSDDDRVHAFTVRLVNDQRRIGCGVYREDTQRFSYYAAVGRLNDCAIDHSGEWLVVKEDRDGQGGEDHRLIYLPTGGETVLLEENGASPVMALGFGVMIAADPADPLPGTIRQRDFSAMSAGLAMYRGVAGQPPSMTELSFSNARAAGLDQQYACGGAVNRTNGPRANEIVCAQLDGSLRTLVVAPVMTDLDAAGGGPNDDAIKQPAGNLDPTGQFYLWTTNLLGDRLDAFLVRVPLQQLVSPPADSVAPAVAVTAPEGAATANGEVTLMATATDNVGVVGVRFRLDGVSIDAEIASPPFTMSWDSTSVPDGVHVISAVARDAAGNLALAVPVEITVQNGAGAPEISGVHVTGVTERLALVSWTTNQLADTRVEYGLSPAYGSSTTLNPALVGSHLQLLTGLIPGATYHYRVISTNAQGLTATSADFTFTTQAAALISGVTASALTGVSASISWTTNVASTSLVEYGLTTTYGDATNMDGTFTTSHLQGLYDLTPGTTYHYRVYSTTPESVLSVSNDFTFTTPSPATPELPRTFIDTTYAPNTGPVIDVGPGEDLQAVLDAAVPGVTIVLDATATFTGNFVLPNKPGAQWIYIVSSALANLPPPGTRVSPASATLMPKIVSPNIYPALTTAAGAHHYRFIGIEITTTWSTRNLTHVQLINLQAENQTTLDVMPHHFTFDRCYVHGTPTGNVRRGLWMQAAFTAVIDSYLDNFHEVASDSQAILSSNAPGPFKIVNNFISAAGENLMFGGADPAIPGLVPADIEIRANHISKSLAWRVGDPSYAGIPWAVKNLLELKNAERVLIEGNVLERVWASGQTGAAILLTPRNEDHTAPWSIVRDVTIRRNILRHAGVGVGLNGTDDAAPSGRLTRVLVQDNLIDDISESWGPGWAFLISASRFGTGPLLGPDYLTIDHNTVFSDAAYAVTDTSGELNVIDRLAFRNNIVAQGQFGFHGSGTGDGGSTLNAFYVAPVFTTSAIVGGISGNFVGYPGLFFPASTNDVQFVDAAAANYQLLPTSPFALAGIDGRDLGVDWSALTGATACAVSGVCAPTISDITLTALTPVSAVINWSTDQATTSQIEYGLTSDYGSLTALDPSLSVAHAMSVTGLSPATTYHFRVRSTNNAGLTSVSGDFTFTTVGPPVIGDVSTSGVGGTTVTVSWSTDQMTTSQVEYGTTTAYGRATTLDPALEMAHSEILTGLSTGTTYHYRVRSENAFGMATTSGDFTFTTVAPPAISGATASAITGTTATVSWTTDQAANTQVEYGATSTYGQTTISDAMLVTLHSQSLSALAPGTTYHYRVRSTNSVGLLVTSGDLTFTTIAAPVISGAGAAPITGTAATISWTTNQPADSQVEYGLTPAYGTSTALDAALVTSHSQGLAGLVPGTTYHSRIRSKNGTGQLSVSPDLVFTTAGAPLVSGVNVSAMTGTSFTINWTTDQAADSQIEYGLTTAYGTTTTLNPALVTAHAQSVTGLSAGTTYHFRVRSANSVGLLTIVGDFTATTPAAFVQSAGGSDDAGSTTIAQAFSGSTAAGNLIVAAVSWDSSATVSCSDTRGNVYIVVPTLYDVVNNQSVGVCYAPNIIGGTTTVTATFSGNASYRRLLVHEYAGIAATSPVDVTAQNIADGTAAANNITTTAATTTVAGALIFGAVMDDAGTTTISAGTNFTARASVGDLVSEDRILATPGTVSATWTFADAHRYMAQLVAFRPRSSNAPAAPAISGVAASGLTGATATIGWTTNQPADSQVDYGLTTTYGSTTALNPALVTAHAQVVTGLAAGTTYHFRVRSTNNVGLSATSADFAFTTSAAPAISAVAATGVTGTAATIGWTTDQPADSQVDYGPTTTYGATTPVNPALVTAHGLDLSGLSPGTTYHYRVRSRNNAGAVTTSAGAVFTTVAPPVISGVASSAITRTTATIGWATNQAADSQVEYGTTTAYGQVSTLGATPVLAHSQGLAGLGAGTTYHYRVRSMNSAGLLSTSGDFVLVTEFPPPSISEVTASPVTGLTATIGWTTDQPADSQVEYGLTTNYGSASTLAPALVTAHSQLLTGLVTGETYHYRVKSRNASGLLTVSSNATFSTAVPAIISSVAVSNITGSSATIGWTTDQPADSQIEYGLTPAYGSSTPLGGALTTGHSQGVSGLAPGTTYHFRVKSRNSLGLLATSADFTFTTVAPPAITAVGASAITGSTATIGWTTDQPSNSRVEFGVTTNYGNQTALDPALVTLHSQGLTGLTPNTTVHYRVISMNAVGLATTSADFTFTTATPAVISGVTASAITTVSATISWTTDQSASSQVEYGLTTVYGTTTTLDPAMVTSHSQLVTGLNAGTTYHYRVRSVTSAGLPSVSGDFVFTTQVVALRQSAGGTNDLAGTTIAQSLSGPTLAGNLIVAAVSWGADTTLTCSDTQGNAYTTLPVLFDGVNNQALAICYAANIAGGNVTVTATFGASASYRRIIVHEYSGIATVNPIDGTAGNIAIGTTAPNNVTTTSVTTATPGDLIFAAVMDDDGVNNIQAGTNFTLRFSVNGSDLATEDRVQNAAGPVAGTWTFSVAHRYLARIVAFKPLGR